MTITRLYLMPVVRALVFFIGCVLLVLIAANLPDFRVWVDNWGALLTVAGFSLATAAGVAAFWFGADGMLANLIGNR